VYLLGNCVFFLQKVVDEFSGIHVSKYQWILFLDNFVLYIKLYIFLSQSAVFSSNV
jgi:hypothetical protein